MSKRGSRIHRQEFIETHYINGVYNDKGEQVIRPLSLEEKSFLNKYYKEFVHGTFNTDAESTRLFKRAKTLSKTKENVKFHKENGFYPEEVQNAIDKFNEKSKSLGNLAYDFFDQREINSDDYKRRYDIQNNSSKGVQLSSFEDLQYVSNVEDLENTIIEDLITESEE
jgi:hypothetical protein